MPISQNKLMPYSDNPSMIEEPAREHRRNPGTSTRKNRPSSRFKLGKFFQKWIMSSRHLKIPGQQQHVNLHDSARFPIKIRPAFCILTLINIILLAIVGFSRTSHSIIAIPKKLFHFFGFALITGLFYSIPDIEDSSKVIWYWNFFNEILTGIVCFFLGGFGSEFIQLFLPWKVFSWGDLLANELGCLAGYQLSRSLHRRYRNKLELSSLYEPLGAGGSSSRDLDLSSEHDEDEEHLNDRQHASSNTLFGANNPELSNVWSDRLEEGHEYFRFEEDEE
ncbi:uncharacterized protein PGTG_12716 [Puccinia graminis f. sp. tritici CRL 75-36-700-3]|uniref:VanZ-like domain-containing protein n=1 Tax=Puccinia graminis f. sp. tritici (strain CRL 75-36-700-3 / race SCCL) TaxID=418459 RepID=E3KRQ0_PUCGT|nr:uncharacterized protein PGTG_12716 [Puccinia graminis f. sp. tritici CRL 75-36-700-3]EFP86975.2 hypothetical protein PGTG_12716 [Puccinia graminis f. sp. tritici CRL 75-36-700-3]